MESIRLYENYTRSRAIDSFDSKGDLRSECDGQWIILDEDVLCFATLQSGPPESHFQSASCFCWVADKAYLVNRDQDVTFLPAEVMAGRKKDRTIHLFAKGIASEQFTYIGTLRPSHRMTLPSGGMHGAADFDLTPSLPSKTSGKLTGFNPGSLDHLAVDKMLARFADPIDVDERLQILQQVAEYWHGQIGPSDGFADEEVAGLAIPYPLRWWYRLAGRRKEIMSGQNILLEPSKLEINNDGFLVFYGENQWCYEWATEPAGDDPAVYGRESDSDPFTSEGMQLSEHLILACLFEAIMCHSPYGASSAWLDEDRLREITETIPPIPIGSWGWASTRFYSKNGAFMFSMDNGTFDGNKGYSVWIGAKTEHPLQFLKPYLDDSWEYVSV